jgi:hypothetical protein
MLVVKVEVWPGGDAEQADPLDVLLIRNMGPEANGEDTDPDLARYQVCWQSRPQDTVFVTHYRRRGWRVLLDHALRELG